MALRLALAGLILLSAPATAYANLIWPVLFVEMRLLTIPVIAAGLLIESLMLRFGFGMSWLRSVLLAVTANAFSAALGAFLIPLAGIVWEIFPSLLIRPFVRGTFNPITWAGTFALAVAITASLEVLCLRFAFKTPWSRRRWQLWLGANAVTVALACVGLFFGPKDIQGYYPWLFG
ncbi:hypothetical protein P7B02_17040 [Caulobacter segnis]|uniref:hypothetical protein n=1 Tax=Caulobacter segnis TaxID=88688 RepID=UPI00240FAA77|nr:hypothetical protein [Caulobacter segnis]MDG2523238.1 hypothetical protein [Caulobacter segnis]